ncbi:MAG: hypothetical protein ACYCO4_02990 [Sulfobacillus sp.]
MSWRTLWVVLGALVVASAAAFAVLTWQAQSVWTPSPSDAAIPVPPPPGSTISSAAPLPGSSLGSGYLHMQTRTYDSPWGPTQLGEYYQSRLVPLGFQSFGEGGGNCPNSAPPGCALWTWDFVRGPNVMFSLNIQTTQGLGPSLFSVSMMRIILPPRPLASIVSRNAQSVRVGFQSVYGAPWRWKVVTSAKAVASLRRMVNSLQAYNCPGSTPMVTGSAAASVVFRMGNRYQAFTTQGPFCVDGPDQVPLADFRMRLLTLVESLFRPAS